MDLRRLRGHWSWSAFALLAAAALVEAAAQLGGHGARDALIRLFEFNPGRIWAAPDAAVGLAAYALVHIGPAHFGLNAFFIGVVGPWVEARWGPWTTLGVIALGVVTGAAGHTLWQLGVAIKDGAAAPLQVGLIGASGPVFALLGAELRARAARLERGPRPPPISGRSFLRLASVGVAAISLVVAVTDPEIAAAAHLGAFFAGLAVGGAAERRLRLR